MNKHQYLPCSSERKMKLNGSETCIPESIPEYVETNAVVKEVHPFHYNV